MRGKPHRVARHAGSADLRGPRGVENHDVRGPCAPCDGTTTLFAALEIAQGKVVGPCYARQERSEPRLGHGLGRQDLPKMQQGRICRRGDLQRRFINSKESMIKKIISGAQTGADRAGLDVALRHGVPHGTWCPKGRKAEDRAIGGQYQLTETPSASSLHCTEWNVRNSDGTAVFTQARKVTGGSLRTIEFAKRHKRLRSTSPAGTTTRA